MDVPTAHLEALFRALRTLEPYRDDIVICGGWVPTLYRRYGSVQLRQPGLLTRDVDIAVPNSLPTSGRPGVDRLLSDAGYGVRMLGSNTPPVTKYELASPPTEIEFLTPEVGRPGNPCRAVQEGLTAQALRYVSILLDNTRQIEIKDDSTGTPFDLVVRVPSPAAFVYQKGLTIKGRGSKAAKDLYYMFEFIDSPDLRDDILSELGGLRKRHPKRWFSTFRNTLGEYFPDQPGEGAILVLSQYSGPMPSETFRLYAQRTFKDFITELTARAA